MVPMNCKVCTILYDFHMSYNVIQMDMNVLEDIRCDIGCDDLSRKQHQNVPD